MNLFLQSRGIIEQVMGAKHKPTQPANYEFETLGEKAIHAVLIILFILMLYWIFRPGIIAWRAKRLNRKRRKGK